ncbi:MAG TPA: NUDIX domain-containing protein [Propionibacteriaceae bacterium]|nr:NUDIX domain-containing protein [Propionibacteriaceae bacterium]
MATPPEPAAEEQSLFDPVNRDRVRPSVKALILRDDRLLVTENSDRTGLFYLLPGGGQHFGESLVEALRRECLEEVGLDVEVGELVAVRDYIGAHHEFAAWDSHYHQLELIFEARIAPGAEPGAASLADSFQTGVRWLPLGELDAAPLYPAALKTWLRLDADRRPVYLGDVN